MVESRVYNGRSCVRRTIGNRCRVSPVKFKALVSRPDFKTPSSFGKAMHSRCSIERVSVSVQSYSWLSIVSLIFQSGFPIQSMHSRAREILSRGLNPVTVQSHVQSHVFCFSLMVPLIFQSGFQSSRMSFFLPLMVPLIFKSGFQFSHVFFSSFGVMVPLIFKSGFQSGQYTMSFFFLRWSP